MRVRFRKPIVVLALLSCVSCGSRPPAVTVTTRVGEMQGTSVNAFETNDALRNISAFLVAVAKRPQSVPPVAPPPAGAATAFDWSCVSIAETGGDFHAHGPGYSSAYGVMDEAVRENAPAAVAARILAGTASRDEQLQMAESVEAKHGVNAWAASTVAKCAR